MGDRRRQHLSWLRATIFLAALGSAMPVAIGAEFGPFSRQNLIEAELSDISMEAAQPFADALARSELLATQMQNEFMDRTPRSALVLYDAAPSVDLALDARLEAIMVRNLLGHFDLDVTLHQVNQYTSGQLSHFDVAIYVGSVFGNPLPEVFLRDAAEMQGTLIWMQYNLEQLEDAVPGTLAARGIAYERTSLFPARNTSVRPPFYDTVFYRGLPFRKVFHLPAEGGPARFDAELVQVSTRGPAITRVEIGNSSTGYIRPYIVQSGNFWFVGDVPISFSGPRDRYVVFADMLHDMLGIDHPVQHLALVRVEDLHARVDLGGYRRLTGLLEERGIPYSLAVIPEYREVLEDGSVLSLPVDAPEVRPFREALLASVTRGAEVIMHGSTHQYGDRPNPERGTTGVDFEFWDVVEDVPIEEDSLSWAGQRLQHGMRHMARAGLSTNLFEVPHYLGSPSAYMASSMLFPFSYHRVTYHGADDLTDLPRDTTYVHEMQFFPYMIYRDHYGQVVVPENLGNLQYVGAVQTPEFLLRNAAYGLAVRDGVASLFIHSFLFVPYSGDPGYSDFSRILDGITAMGYEWIGVHDYLSLYGFDPDATVDRTGTN